MQEQECEKMEDRREEAEVKEGGEGSVVGKGAWTVAKVKRKYIQFLKEKGKSVNEIMRQYVEGELIETKGDWSSKEEGSRRDRRKIYLIYMEE